MRGRKQISILCFILILPVLITACGGSGNSEGGGTPPAPSNPVPTISSLSPSSVMAGAAGQTLTINGANFLSSSTATYNGASHAVTFVGSTQLTISVSATDQAIPGSFAVVVTNPSPGGGSSNSVNFTVNKPPQPVITSVTSIVAATSQDIVISGSGFGSNPPQTEPVGDGSVDTLGCNTTSPSLTIDDNGTGKDAWAAGRQSCTNLDAIGVYLVSWTDSQIILSGFGSALGTTNASAYEIAAGDPIHIDVTGPNGAGDGVYNASVASNSQVATLTVNIIDLPGNTPGAVTVTGPGGLNLTLTSSLVVAGVAGTYDVVASGVVVGSSTYYATMPTQSTTLAAGNSSVLTVDYYDIIPNTTKVLDPAGMQGLQVSPDGKTLTIPNSSAVAQSLAVGDVLITGPAPAAPYGLLVSVLTVTESGSNVIATVTDASLEEAIQRISVDVSLPFAAASPDVAGPSRVSKARAPKPNVAGLSDSCSSQPVKYSYDFDVPLTGNQDGSYVTPSKLDGSVEICPTFNFKLKMDLFTIQSLTMAIQMGEHADVNAEIGELLGISEEYDYPLPPNPEILLPTFLIPGTPIWITPRLVFFLEGSGNVQAAISDGIEEDATLQVGASYDGGTWTPINQRTSSFAEDPLSLDGGLSIKGALGARVDFLVYDQTGPSIGVDVYSQFDANISQNPWWTLSAGIEGPIGFHVTVFGFKIKDYDLGDVFNYSIPLDHANGNLLSSEVTPSLAQLSPAAANAGSPGFSLTLTGSGFVPDSVVNFNGTALTTTFVDLNDLTAVLPAAELLNAGVFPVTVTNPDTVGATSGAVNFTIPGSTTNPVPSISSLSPSSLPAGAVPQTLTINGTGFLANSTVTFNGIAHTPTYVGTGRLTISLTTADLTTAGSFPVVVTNPTPGGGASNAVEFAVMGSSGINVVVSPSSAQVTAGASQQFTATVTGTSNTAVNWSVNGVTGGNSTVGTITGGGLYTAPATVPSPATVTVTAASQATPSASGSATVTVGPYTVKNLYSFTSLTDGAAPSTALIQASDGFFYGTTQVGGTYGDGTVFKVDSSGSVTTLHEFSGSDGAYPLGALVQANDGYFYGTTNWGGTYNYGTVFKTDSAGNFHSLYSFTGGTDGGNVEAGLVQASDGFFYGTTFWGGNYNSGTVFRVDSLGNLTTLYSFSGGSDGYGPESSLIQSSDGYLYGTTLDGGNLSCEIWPITGCGTIFKIDTSGHLVTLYSFSGGTDGANPDEALMQTSDGSFYGTTVFGGDPSCTVSTYMGCGTIFKIDSGGHFSALHQFSGGSEGGVPFSSLIQSTDGDFYGTATAGGDPSCSVIASGENFPTYIGCGTVFKMDSTGNVSALYSFTGSPNDGSNPFAALVQGNDGFFYGTTRWGGTDSSCSYTNNGGCGTVFRLAGPGGPAPQQLVIGSPLRTQRQAIDAHSSPPVPSSVGALIKKVPAGPSNIGSLKGTARPH